MKFSEVDRCAQLLWDIMLDEKPEDYIELAALLKEVSLQDAFDAWKKKYCKTSVMPLKYALCNSQKISEEVWSKYSTETKDYKLIPCTLIGMLIQYNKQFHIG